MSPLCLVPGHPHLKTSTETWLAGTERMPHHQHAEAVTDDGVERLNWRNCASCKSTVLAMVDGNDQVVTETEARS